MSRNVLKRGFTTVNEDETRIIDSNLLMAQKCGLTADTGARAERTELGPEEEDGFAPGISAEILDVLTGGEDGEVRAVEAHDASAPEMQGPSYEEIMEQAQAELAQMQEQMLAEIEQEKRNALEQARNQGYREGLQKAQQENEALRREIEAERGRVQAEYESMVQEFEPMFIDTLSGIYEHIFNVDLSAHRDLIVHLIESTLHKVDAASHIIVHVSKEDYPYVSMHKKELLSGISGEAEIVEDITLGKNQAMLETENGIYDCSLGTQLKELGQKLRLLSYEKQ